MVNLVWIIWNRYFVDNICIALLCYLILCFKCIVLNILFSNMIFLNKKYNIIKYIQDWVTTNVYQIYKNTIYIICIRFSAIAIAIFLNLNLVNILGCGTSEDLNA